MHTMDSKKIMIDKQNDNDDVRYDGDFLFTPNQNTDSVLAGFQSFTEIPFLLSHRHNSKFTTI